MNGVKASDIVQSLAGHDSGRLYVVIGAAGDRALLADGKTRRLSKPKRKSLRHLRRVGRVEPPPGEAPGGGPLQDSEIRRVLAAFRQTRTTD